MSADDSATDAVYELRVHRSIRDIGELAWDALASPTGVPFLSFAWLDTLESTGCVGADTGWHPHHLSLHLDGEIVGLAPAYLKEHSQGEFVFDHGWANSAFKFGVRYFPKLLIAVPFTPATAPRLLIRESADQARVTRVFASGLLQLVDESRVSSAHLLFPHDEQAEALEELGLSHRYGVQFHWKNDGFATFEDFLSTLPSKRRTAIRRERRELQKQGIRLTTLRGSDITEEAIHAMYGFYAKTVDQFMWGRHYLNRQFFTRVCDRLSEGIEIVLAHDAGGRAVGGAFNLCGAGTLFGRYWGGHEDYPFLHFNVCYYHSIDECIERGLQRFEPGAGGSHKVARGFYPTFTHSLHHFADPTFGTAIDDFVTREKEALVEHFVTECGRAPQRIG